MSDLAALEFIDVTVRWQREQPPALAGVSFTLGAGERCALVGRNGSGKTSLLLAAVGVAPFSGVVRLGGEQLGPANAARLRRRVGFLGNVPEDQLLFPDAREDVALALVQQGEARPAALARAAALLAALGAAEAIGRPLAQLSHGIKQRVALAGALIGAPGLLLLDEPSAGLDPPGRVELARMLACLPAAMLIATHDLDFAARVCGRFLLLDAGNLVYDGADPSVPWRRWGMGWPAGGAGGAGRFLCRSGPLRGKLSTAGRGWSPPCNRP